MLKKFEVLPEDLKNESVLYYYKLLQKKCISLFVKRVFDFTASLVMLLMLCPILVVIAVLIRTDSKGSPIFKQERITRYGRKFYIYKFRTMYTGSDKGSQITLKNDIRVTRMGAVLRKYRLDELLQLINILKGDMSFVGTRPEVEKYVKCYTDEMYATLLLPAGVTSLASIKYKNEEKLLESSEDTDRTYVREILPAKMKYNLEYIANLSVTYDIYLMLKTVFAVIKKGDISENSANRKEETIIERM